MDPNGDAIDRVQFDPERETYRASYSTEETPGLALVEAISAIEDTDPITLEPLGDAIDVDALDAVVQSTPDSSDMQVSVSYQGYQAFIYTDGSMELHPTDSEAVGSAE